VLYKFIVVLLGFILNLEDCCNW